MTIAEILNGAAELLDQPGVWGQSKIDGVRGSHCVYTAICAASKRGWELRRDACSFLGKIVGIEPTSAKFGFGFFEWNDKPGRTQDEVTTALREAASLARQEEERER